MEDKAHAISLPTLQLHLVAAIYHEQVMLVSGVGPRK